MKKFGDEKFHANGGTCAAPQNKVVDTLYFRAVTGDAISETDGTGSTQNEYVFFGGQRIARRDAGGNVYYYYADQVGSATVITNATGTPCYQATFTPYGEEHATQSTCPQNYKFTGYERDAETGLDYAFARYYNSRLGRFMSADPLEGDITDPQSLNRYAYVRNTPTSLTDPSGMLLSLGSDDCWGGFCGGSEGPGWLGQPGFWIWNPDLMRCDNGECLSRTEKLEIGGRQWIAAWPAQAGGGGVTPKCTLSVRVNDRVGLPPIQLGRLENQVNSLFGPLVQVNFFGSGSPSYTLNIQNAPPSVTDLGQGSSSFPATVYANNVNRGFGSESFRTVGTIFGTVAAHELFHSITGSGDNRLDPSNPNDIMSIDALIGRNPELSYQLIVGNGLVLTPRELNKLLRQCLKNQQTKGR